MDKLVEKTIALPRALTAENGAKYLLIGEFSESIELPNPDYCGCGDCDFCDIDNEEFEDETYLQEVPVSWTTIKAIYKKIVDHFEKQIILDRAETRLLHLQIEKLYLEDILDRISEDEVLERMNLTSRIADIVVSIKNQAGKVEQLKKEFSSEKDS